MKTMKLSEFFPGGWKNPLYQPVYRILNKDKRNRYREDNREKLRQQAVDYYLSDVKGNNLRCKKDYYRRKYRKTVEEAELLQAPGPCEICGQFVARRHIDHEKGTTNVRGSLCTTCNTSLGGLGDSIVGLKKALAYLERYEHAKRNAA